MDFDYPTSPTSMQDFRPRESERSIYTEKKFGDGRLSLWELTELPDDAVVTHVTLIPYRGERVVIAWRNGAGQLPEGNVGEGESAEDAVRRIAEAQTGILEPTIVHLGHLRTRQPDGRTTYDVLYGLEVGSLADFPSDRGFDRRIVVQRDLNTLIRANYIELRREFTDSLDRWLVQRIKAGQIR